FDVAADHRAEAATDAARIGDNGAAVSAARDAVDLRPDELRLRLLLATLLVADQRGTAPALRQVDAALVISPGDPIALRRRAELLVQRASSTLLPDDIDKARRELARLVAADPSNGELQLLAGTAYGMAQDPERSAAAFRRAE